MGHPDGAHTHGSGGSGIGAAVLVLLAVMVASAIARPVIHAAYEVISVVFTALAVILGVGLVAGVAVVAWRLRRRHANRITAVSFPAPLPRRPAESLPAPRSPAALPPGQEIHVHLHGVSAEDIAAILHARGHGGRA